MPQYMLLIYNPADAGEPTPEQLQEIGSAYDAYTQSLVEAGVLVGGDALERADTATTVHPASPNFEIPPRRICPSTSKSPSCGKHTIASAVKGEPPIAYTSLRAFAAAI